MKNYSPAISVVIPMYNAEKYIGDCLDSILAQTFTDFEVIVVDDCSTDNSKKIVESYIPKFYSRDTGGKIELKVVSTEKNSGNPGIPTNLGIKLSRGKYIFFMDNDDLITKTALEEVFNLAEKFQADVVHCEKYFKVPEDWKIGDKRELEIEGLPTNNFVTTPTLITQNFTERAKNLGNYQFVFPLWTKLIQRDFLEENNIQMTDVKVADLIFTCCIVSSAKKYLRVPNIVNFCRMRSESISHKVETNAEVLIQSWVSSIVAGFNYLNDFLDGEEYFQKNLDAKYLVLETVVNDFSRYLLNLYTQIPASQLNALIQQEFAKCRDLTELATFIFSRMNIFNVNLIQQQNAIQQLQAQIQNSQVPNLQIQNQQNNFSQKVPYKKSSHKKKR